MEELDELFAVEPGEFVARRNALVRSLKKEGRREEAAEVQQLRRPPAPVWAANQLARRRPDEVAELLDAGAALPAAQEALLSGDRGAFRDAVDRHRRLVSDLASVGAELVAEHDVAAGDQRREVAATLEAASTIPEAARQLGEGRLRDRPDALGDPAIGLAAARGSPSGRPGPDGGQPDDDESQRQRERAARRAEAEARLADAKEALDAAERQQEEQAREVAERQAALVEAQDRLADAEAQRRAARDAVTEAEHDLAGR